MATVSRVLNNSMQVIPETRERVLRAMEKLGYDYGARKMEGNLSHKNVILLLQIQQCPKYLTICAAPGRRWASGDIYFTAWGMRPIFLIFLVKIRQRGDSSWRY